MTPDHAAALALLRVGATIPRDLAKALYRAGVEYQREQTRPVKDYGLVSKRRSELYAALAAVADKLTKEAS